MRAPFDQRVGDACVGESPLSYNTSRASSARRECIVVAGVSEGKPVETTHFIHQLDTLRLVQFHQRRPDVEVVWFGEPQSLHNRASEGVDKYFSAIGIAAVIRLAHTRSEIAESPLNSKRRSG